MEHGSCAAAVALFIVVLNLSVQVKPSGNFCCRGTLFQIISHPQQGLIGTRAKLFLTYMVGRINPVKLKSNQSTHGETDEYRNQYQVSGIQRGEQNDF
jgi:hypothetical protein